MGIVLNLADVKTTFEPVPVGNYDVSIVKAEQTLSKSSNQPMIAVQYRINSPEEHEGRLLFDNFSLQPQALWKLKTLLEALAWPGTDEDGLELSVDELIGAELIVSVIQEPGRDGNLRNVVKGYGGGDEDTDLDLGLDEVDFEGAQY